MSTDAVSMLITALKDALSSESIRTWMCSVFGEEQIAIQFKAVDCAVIGVERLRTIESIALAQRAALHEWSDYGSGIDTEQRCQVWSRYIGLSKKLDDALGLSASNSKESQNG